MCVCVCVCVYVCMCVWGGVERGWNSDTDPASSCLPVKTPGGKQERNDKTSSINILSTLLADVYRQFHTTATDSLLFSLFFYMAFYFLSSCQPASHLLSVYMESALSSFALGFRVGELCKNCDRIIFRGMLLPTRHPKDMGL